jgi:ABC-type iron transport system FetAB ATPase subunit
LSRQVRIEGLCNHALGPLSFSLNAGECVALSGPSGVGKTLLLRAIADLDLHQGQVFLNEVECQYYTGAAWRRQIGLLPTESQWWRDRVGEHFARLDTDLLEKIGFGADVMGWQVSRLSSGERQRLALVRLLSLTPAVLLLDEPTASLDQDKVRRVEALLAEYRHVHQAPVLWVSHDPQQVVRVADRTLYLEDSKRLTEGAAG